MNQKINHDLTPEELDEFIRRTRNGRSKWRRVTRNGQRVYKADVHHDGEEIIAATADGDHDTSFVVRAVFDAVSHRAKRRSDAAKKAAATRARRRRLKIDQIVRYLIDGGTLTPRANCRICGKAVTDSNSRQRGIGSDCWQTVMRYLEDLRGGAAATPE